MLIHDYNCDRNANDNVSASQGVQQVLFLGGFDTQLVVRKFSTSVVSTFYV